jgi:hypothetical protein
MLVCGWISSQATGHRVAVAKTSGNVAPTPFRAPFPVLPSETAINLRALVDRSIVVRWLVGVEPHMTCWPRTHARTHARTIRAEHSYLRPLVL